MIFSKNEQEFIVEQMRRVGIEVYAATEHFVTCKGASWVPYAVAVAKRANAKVEVFKEPTGGFCYRFQPDLGSWEYTEIEEAAVEAFLNDNGDNYIPEEMILAADFLMP